MHHEIQPVIKLIEHFFFAAVVYLKQERWQIFIEWDVSGTSPSSVGISPQTWGSLTYERLVT